MCAREGAACMRVLAKAPGSDTVSHYSAILFLSTVLDTSSHCSGGEICVGDCHRCVSARQVARVHSSCGQRTPQETWSQEATQTGRE
jgi:hypothetical protein